MCLIEPGPRSATIKAATDVECLAACYEEFIAAIEENPSRAVGFMKTLVRRLRLMNELIESTSPSRGGFRGLFLDWQKVGGPRQAPLRSAGPLLDDAVVSLPRRVQDFGAAPEASR